MADLTNPPTGDSDRLALQSAGALAEVVGELDALQARLAAAPDWQPATRLKAELDWARARIAQLAAAWGSKLVVVLAGPSGTGKSTLLNALAGREISPTGLARPTTREIIAYVAAEADVEGLRERWGDTPVTVQAEPAAAGLAHLVLIDAPDTNTTVSGLAALGRVLETADILAPVFAAQNPRLQDNIFFLGPFVHRMPVGAVVPVLNMVDRAPMAELNHDVVPDLYHAMRRDWGMRPERIYLVSARASLPNASFPADEEPLHDVNEFDAFRAHLFESLNRANQVVDRRLARARRLVELVAADMQAAVDAQRDNLMAARRQLGRIEASVTTALRNTLRAQADVLRGLDLHAALYGRLAARWWGPLGWIVAVWGALVRASAWAARLGSHGRSPLAGPDGAGWLPALGGLDQALDNLYAEQWPPVADALAAAGFAGLRERRRWLAEAASAGDRLQVAGARAVDEALERSVTILAHPLLQVLLNAPVLALLGWTGYQAVVAFITGAYLPASYFQNAGIALLSVWAGCFVLLQLLVSLTVRVGLRRRMAHSLAGAASWRLAQEVGEQIAGLLQ